MKEILYFLPALIFSAFYVLVVFVTALTISPIIFVWIAAFIVAGILLSKGLFWGGCFGMLPGIHLMYMSTIDTGQIFPIEMPIGIIIVTFYVLCCGFVLYKNKKSKK